jgi:hypothetical protein
VIAPEPFKRGASYSTTAVPINQEISDDRFDETPEANGLHLNAPGMTRHKHSPYRG